MPISYDRKKFFDAVRSSVFEGWMSSKQVSGTEAILGGWEKHQPEGDTRFIAYMLATANWETAHSMQPIEEIGRGRGRAYGEPAGPYRQVYYGRGLVQLTWLADYEKADKELHALGVLKADESLVRTPTLVLRPDVAAAIMIFGMSGGWFTGRKLETYFNGAEADWVNARRIINGTDHDQDVARIAEHFYAALKASLITAPVAPVAQAAPATA